MPKRIDPEKRVLSLQLRLSGKRVTDVAREMGKSVGTISAWTHEFMPEGYDDTFLSSDSELRSYFLGLFVADGWLDAQGGAYLALNDKQLIDDLVLATRYRRKVSVIPLRKWKSKELSGRISYRLCYLRRVSIDLKELGFTPKKTGREFVPAGLSATTLCHFIRGLSDGDGTVGVVRNRDKTVLQWGLVSASQSFLGDILSRLQESAGVSSDARIIPKRTPTGLIYKIQLGFTDSIAVCQFMYQGATIKLLRKYEKWVKGSNLPPPKKKRPWTEAEKELVLQGMVPEGRTKTSFYQMRKRLQRDD